MSAMDAEAVIEAPPEMPEKVHGYFMTLCGVGVIVLMAALVGYGVFGAQITAGLDDACAEAALDAGRKLEEAGSTARAIQKYRQALGGNMRDEEERFRCALAIGDILYREKRYSEALAAYRELPQDKFTTAGAYTGYVGALWQVGETEEATRLSAPWLALAIEEQNVEQQVWARNSLLQAAEAAGDLTAAEAQCRRILALDPGSSAALKLASIFRRNGALDEARRQAESFLATTENPALKQSARAFLAELDKDAARAGES